MNIRPETPADYAAIALLHLRAFGNIDGMMVSHMHRQYPHYDPALALVAEQDQHIIGHILFTPHTIRLLEADVACVVLSPLGIDPTTQKQGVGGALIQEGHRVAREKGYTMSFVLGHDTYYPRFGYRINAYGSASLPLTVSSLPAVDPSVLTVRLPVEADVETLIRLWRYEEGRVDFAILPDAGFLDWISPNSDLKSQVYQRDGAIVGFTLIHETHPTKPAIFIAADAHAAQTMAALIGQDHETITLPLHPYSASTAVLGQAQAQPWSAGMAYDLQGDTVATYFDQVQRGVRIVGRPKWGRAYDIVGGVS